MPGRYKVFCAPREYLLHDVKMTVHLETDDPVLALYKGRLEFRCACNYRVLVWDSQTGELLFRSGVEGFPDVDRHSDHAGAL